MDIAILAVIVYAATRIAPPIARVVESVIAARPAPRAARRGGAR